MRSELRWGEGAVSGRWERDRGANHSIGQSRKEGNRGRMDGGDGRATGWDIRHWQGQDYSVLPHRGRERGRVASVPSSSCSCLRATIDGRMDGQASERGSTRRPNVASFLSSSSTSCASKRMRGAICAMPLSSSRLLWFSFPSCMPPACEVGFCHLRPRPPQLPLGLRFRLSDHHDMTRRRHSAIPH